MPIFSSQQKGQSIVEVIIAVGILGTAVAAALTLTMAALNAQKENEGWMLATNLAREGVEVVRNMRDTNWLSDLPWNEGLSGLSDDYTAIPVFDPDSGDWVLDFFPEILVDNSTIVWQYSTGHIGTQVQSVAKPSNTTATRYHRLLLLHPICKDHSVVFSGNVCPELVPQVGIRIQSRVSWNSSGRDRQIEIVDNI